MPFILATVPQWASTWLTPIWLLGLGAIIGLAILLLGWLIMFCVNRTTGKLVPSIVREGPLFPIFVLVCLLASFGVVGTMAVRRPAAMLKSLQRLPWVGTTVHSFEIEPGSSDMAVDLAQLKPQKLDILLDEGELVELRFQADVNMIVSAYSRLLTETEPRFQVSGGDEFTWTRGDASDSPFPAEQVEALYVWNSDVQPTKLRISTVTAPQHSEVIAIPFMAGFIVFIFLAYFLPRAIMPKISAVALATTKSEMAQPLFLICMILGCFFLTLFLVLPYNTFGEDIKMFKDSGLTLIMILSIITCLWAASNSISEEIDGRTALTVLSKPIGRRQFILGKFVGIIWVAALMFLMLGLWFVVVLAYKPLYDARETANLAPAWQECYLAIAQTAPGLAMGFFETIVLASVSVAISTRLPLLANFVICISVYAMGHLTPMIVKSSIGTFEPVLFVARLIATVLPVLEHFDIKPAIAGGVDVPLSYLGWSFVYCVLYSAAAMLLALTLFEDRDLA